MIWAVKSYGTKNILARLLDKLFKPKKGWIRLYVPFIDDWHEGY